MLEKATIILRELTADTGDSDFIVRVKIFNPVKRTLYAYGNPRRILYDNATNILTLCLHDQHVEADSIISRHLPEPNFVLLEGNVETEIKIYLPKIINRIRSAAERNGQGAISEQLQISEAKEIELEIAHQDTPFYYNPKIDNATQLKEWGRIIAKENFKLKR
jgi:hypothetical protein